MSIAMPVRPKMRNVREITPAAPAFDVRRIRADFPILQQRVNGKPLVYLDNGATTQKPRQVIEALRNYYERDNANIHRAVHQLSERSTRAYEEARVKVQHFLHARQTKEIVFTRGTTEAINLVAHSFGRKFIKAGDEIIITHMEHHSNIVPWQLLCEATGAILKVVPINGDGELLHDEYENLLSDRTKLVSVVHLSNALGTVNPVRHIIELAHARDIFVLLDGAQSASHLTVDVQELDCDFFAFSGHKVYGPTGIGVLYGKAELLEQMPPYQGGGDMIKSVTFAKTTYADLPNKFEAGTPNIAGVIGLGAALDYLLGIGIREVETYEELLLRYATDKLRQIPGIRIIGNAAHKAGLISFVIDDPPLSSLDIGTKLDLEGIAVRTGHHCCQPVMDRFGIPGTVRASFAIYNTTAELDHLSASLEKIVSEAAARQKIVLPLAHKEPVFPAKAAESPQAAADELAEVFEFFDGWDERYHQILEMGEKLPAMPDALKTEANRVHGCQSIVHMYARIKSGTTDVVEFLADSNADLVRGLIALLQQLFGGQRAQDMVAFDVEGFFAKIGLDQHLTLGRRNGLAAMVERIRKFAADVNHE